MTGKRDVRILLVGDGKVHTKYNLFYRSGRIVTSIQRCLATSVDRQKCLKLIKCRHYRRQSVLAKIHPDLFYGIVYTILLSLLLYCLG